MNVEFPESELAQLQELALQTGRGTEELVREAVSRMLGDDHWFRAEVKKGLEQIRKGEFLEESEMDARILGVHSSPGLRAS